jgi:hypothetical protein
MLSDVRRVRSIKASPYLSENTLLNKPGEIVSWDAESEHIFRAYDLLLGSQVE